MNTIESIRAEFNQWPQWWQSQSKFEKIFPLAFGLIYCGALHLLNGLRSDHVLITFAIATLTWGGPFARKLRRVAAPFLLTGIIYDSQRFYSDLIRGPIHVEEPYQFDKTYFGIETQWGRLTPNEFLQHHLHPVLDLITGFSYLTFFTIFIIQSAIFYLFHGKNGTSALSPLETQKAAHRMIWGFFWLNLIGYSTYYWYAASPPWYVALYGLGPARLDVPANPAGCIRFDELLGTHFFTGMYGRSADVHGAIPSLHIAYPLLAAIYSFIFKKQRVFSVLFYGIMCFSAVYLNHHYVLDLIWGSAYTVGVALFFEYYWKNSQKMKSFEPLELNRPQAAKKKWSQNESRVAYEIDPVRSPSR